MFNALYYFVLAVVCAALEIEIEGRSGWAYDLPTWYHRSGATGKIWGRLSANRPLTGYHLFFFSFILLNFHAPFFWNYPWSVPKELEVIGFYLIWSLLEDFLWFVLNPHFKLTHFKRQYIWWYSRRKWPFDLMPPDYLACLLVAVAVTTAACLLERNLAPVGALFQRLAVFVGGSLSMIALSPAYHKWYLHMRKRDERSLLSLSPPSP